MSVFTIQSTGTNNVLCNYDKTSIRSTQADVPWVLPNTTSAVLGKYTLDSTNLAQGSVVGLTRGGLYGQYFNGDWRSTISTGNIGTLPLSSPTLYTSISYTTRGDYYGFIAIGYFIPPTTGTYTFYTSSDDSSGVWVGDLASASSGRTAANATLNNNLGGGQGDTKRSGTASLTANQVYAIRIVHEEGGGGDNLTYSWSGPGISETTSLSNYYYYYGSGTNFASSLPTVGYSSQSTITPVINTNPSRNTFNFLTQTNTITTTRGITDSNEPYSRITVLTNSNQSPYWMFEANRGNWISQIFNYAAANPPNNLSDINKKSITSTAVSSSGPAQYWY